jgi:hypothetical protein
LQSNARNRAVDAVEWMCNTLDLGLPIDMIEKPAVQEESLNSRERKRLPTAQPGQLKALEDTMEAAATDDSPTWLALLASWMQAMANLRLTDLLRRSVPVELYSDWIVFFCKQSKRKHDRAGFYWGVPSVTSSGYIWTVKFFEEYNRRRDSIAGAEMMGMIFRTDTHEYLSSSAVKAITLKAISGIVDGPELLATYSWRGMLPAAALLLGFSPAERLAVGESRNVESVSDEAPIIRRFAEAREGNTRVCKLICAKVFAELTKADTLTFDEVPVQRWEQLAKKARDEIGSQALSITLCWRNADVADSGGGFKVRKSQITFPKQLNGVPLAPSNRAGARYCGDYQSNSCQQREPCQLGLHKCAALFKAGRTCHGNHAGMDCRTWKKHAVIEGALDDQPRASAPKAEPRRPDIILRTALEVSMASDDSSTHPMEVFPSDHERPLQKRAKHADSRNQLQPEEDVVMMTATSKAMPKGRKRSLLKCVYDDSIMQGMLPQLRGRKGVRGNRINPEPPSLVAKVCNEEGKGELWLGPLPTAERMPTILETMPSIQIYCFRADPTAVTVEGNRGRGMHIPGAILFRCEMSNQYARLLDMQMLRPCVIDSLRQGDNAYIHCVSGITRAPLAAALLCATLMNINLDEAMYIINQCRNVDFNSGRNMHGAWIPKLLEESHSAAEEPTGFSCSVTKGSNKVVHATTFTKSGKMPICRWKDWNSDDQDLSLTAQSIERASSQFGGIFCAHCKSLMRATLQMQVKRSYS